MTLIRPKWRCQHCRGVRPDAAISVKTVPLIIKETRLGAQNFRYCNDRPDCVSAAQAWTGYALFPEKRVSIS